MALLSRKAVQFIFWAYLISWTIGGVIFLFSEELGSPGRFLLTMLYMFGPLAASLIVLKQNRSPVASSLGVSFRPNLWFLVAWLLPVLLVFLTLGISLLFPDVTFTPDLSGLIERYQDTLPPEAIEQMEQRLETLPVHPIWVGILSGLVAGATINAVAAFGEEAGWRGLLLRELAPLGFWKSSLLIGVIWGFWHAPIILQGHNYPEHPVAGVVMMIFLTLVFTPVINYVRLRARSVIAAALMHGTFNGLGGIPILVITGGTDLKVGSAGLAGILAFIPVIAGLMFYERVSGKVPTVDQLLEEVELEHSTVEDDPGA